MHLYIEGPALRSCLKCGKAVLSHTVCQSCGYYKGREVIDVMKKLTKKERKQKEKELKAKETADKKDAEGSLNWQKMSKK